MTHDKIVTLPVNSGRHVGHRPQIVRSECPNQQDAARSANQVLPEFRNGFGQWFGTGTGIDEPKQKAYANSCETRLKWQSGISWANFPTGCPDPGGKAETGGTGNALRTSPQDINIFGEDFE